MLRVTHRKRQRGTRRRLILSGRQALLFGRIADLAGRKHVSWLVAAIMVVAALGSALAPSFCVLIRFRFRLGLGAGGDYPVSAVLMSEYANWRISAGVGLLPEPSGRSLGDISGQHGVVTAAGLLLAKPSPSHHADRD